MEKTTKSLTTLNNGDVAQVRGKRFLVKTEVQEMIGGLYVPESRKAENKTAVIVAVGDEVENVENITIGKTLAVYADGKGVDMGHLEDDENTRYELLKDEDVLMIINK